MNRERIEAWVSALESDEYAQTTHTMREPLDFDLNMEVTGWAYCALGVGMKVAEGHGVEVAVVDWWPGRFSFEVKEWYGLDETDPRIGKPHSYGSELRCDDRGHPIHVSDLNDTGSSFWDIAQILRAKYLKEEG